MRGDSWGGAVGVAVTTCAMTVHAEVMDKVTPPWEPLPMLLTAGVAVLCLLLARRGGWAMAAATALASLWAALHLSDELHDPFIGPAIRSELSTTAVTVYQWLLYAQALLPAVLSVGIFGARRSRVARRPER